MNSPSKLTFSAWLSSRTGRVVLSLALVLALAFFVRAYVDIFGGSDEEYEPITQEELDCGFGDISVGVDNYAACLAGEPPLPTLTKELCGLNVVSVDLYVACTETIRNNVTVDPDSIDSACGIQQPQVTVLEYAQCLEEWEQSEAVGGR